MVGVRNMTGSLRAARFFVAALATVWWLGAVAENTAAPEPASGFAPRPSVYAAHAMAVTANPFATDAAEEILALGGSAVDAAIAAQFVLNLVEPQSSGIGGGGFMLHYDAVKRRVAAYDGRETAPHSATPQRFVDSDGRPRPLTDVVATGRSVGVPGLVAMLALAHEKHGKLRWERLLRPAIRLAEQGFPISPRLHHLLDVDRFLRDDPEARALYYRSDGSPLPVGTRLVNTSFAATLRTLSAQGPGTLYHGELAEAIVIAANRHPRGGGDLDVQDLRDYRAIERTPVCGAYRRYRICGMPPPSSGGITVLQLLGILQRTDFSAAANSAAAAHYFAEAGRLAFADRRRYLGDPDFVAVPQSELLDAAYLDRRASLISSKKSFGNAAPGELSQLHGRGDDTAPELPATTHLSIVDGQGNAVAMTSSIEDAFGSRTMVRGFLLNNQLTDFSFQPDELGRPLANQVQGGKRPLSSMAPTLVFDAQDRLYAVLGSPGGAQIINYVAQTLTALLDWHLTAEAALALPHYGSRNGPTELEADSAAADLAPALQRLGHRVELREMNSGTHLIIREGVGWRGAADPRREGTARGD
jgi:gamma-glutamyltranspeptidase/glutathione hydrolase